jgi:hypothetical protein
MTSTRHGPLALALALAVAAGCAAAHPAVDVRSTLPARATTQTVLDVLSAAFEPKEFASFKMNDDYLVTTSWHVVARGDAKVVVARARVYVDRDGAHVRTDRRECSSTKATCDLPPSPIDFVRDVDPTFHVDLLPEARDATLFDERTLAARIEERLARR